MAVVDSCNKIKIEYHQCLNASNRNPSKCSSLENSLRECGKRIGMNYCVDETVNLLECSRNPSRDLCAKEFLQMRECNRPGGPEILLQGGKYVIAENQLWQFQREIPEICSMEAPGRSRASLDKTIKKLRSLIGLKNFEQNVVAYK